MTQKQIAAHFNVTQKVILSFMKRHSIPTRKPYKRNQFLENNCNWRGGITWDEFGYVMVRCEGHPRASKRGHYVPEHILVVEAKLGRYLTLDEVVHHRNGEKWDNRPDNLSVMSKAAHTRLHAAMRKLLKASPKVIEERTPTNEC